jgi:hypothetical protein
MSQAMAYVENREREERGDPLRAPDSRSAAKALPGRAMKNSMRQMLDGLLASLERSNGFIWTALAVAVVLTLQIEPLRGWGRE